MANNQSRKNRKVPPETIQDSLKSFAAKVVHQPHDTLFRALLSDPHHANALMRKCLPEHIVSQLADDVPEILDGGHIDENLRSTRSDLLVKSKLTSGDGTGHIFLVGEHKSYDDRKLVPQLLSYLARVYARLAAQEPPLEMGEFPAVILWVIYTGDTQWDGPSNIRDMISPKQLKRLGFEVNWPIVSSNLTETPLNELPEPAGLRAGLVTLTGRYLKHAEAFDDVGEENRLLLHQLVWYLSAILPGERLEELPAQLLAKIGERRDSMRTIAQNLMLKGEAKGEARGEARGRVKALAETIIRQLEQRFGPLPDPTKQRISAAGLDQLDIWVLRILDAKNVDEVLRHG